MSDVDAILASGVYVDRRGSRWERTDQGGYTQWWSEDEWPCIEHADMRRLIERDLHRAPKREAWQDLGDKLAVEMPGIEDEPRIEALAKALYCEHGVRLVGGDDRG